jgi:hypothetical protein
MMKSNLVRWSAGLGSIAGPSLEPVDEIDHVVEPPADTGPDVASGWLWPDGSCRYPYRRPLRHCAAGDKVPAGELVDQWGFWFNDVLATDAAS